MSDLIFTVKKLSVSVLQVLPDDHPTVVQVQSLTGVDANWQKVVKGLVLLAAVVFEIFNNRDKKKA